MKNFVCLLVIFISFNVFSSMEGLKVGEYAPDLVVKDTDNKVFNFSTQKKDTIVIFFRGSWCPYCITQLKKVQEEIVPKINKKSQIVAISVDQLKIAKKMKNKLNLSYTVLSDPKAKSLKAFKIINQLSQDLVTKYKNSYQIDVEGDSGETHHMVAHPAVFIIKQGKITFADVQKNYKQRTENKLILNALK